MYLMHFSLYFRVSLLIVAIVLVVVVVIIEVILISNLVVIVVVVVAALSHGCTGVMQLQVIHVLL